MREEERHRSYLEKMVEEQIRSRGVQDERVLDAMKRVPRHLYAPGYDLNRAYGDYPLPIGQGQTISQPYIVAFMTELCQVGPGERVLEVGTGSGYQTAILAEMGVEVFSIERIRKLTKASEGRLQGYSNVHLTMGDGYEGWPEEAPFDAIILTAAPPRIPDSLTEQLAEGGRLVAPEGTDIQRLVVIRKEWGRLEREDHSYVRFVPMEKGLQ